MQQIIVILGSIIISVCIAIAAYGAGFSHAKVKLTIAAFSEKIRSLNMHLGMAAAAMIDDSKIRLPLVEQITKKYSGEDRMDYIKILAAFIVFLNRYDSEHQTHFGYYLNEASDSHMRELGRLLEEAHLEYITSGQAVADLRRKFHFLSNLEEF